MRNTKIVILFLVLCALLCCMTLTSCCDEEQPPSDEQGDVSVPIPEKIKPCIMYNGKRLVSYGTSTNPELLEIYKEYIQSGKYIYVGQVADSCSPSQKPTEHLTTNCGFVGDEVYRDVDSDEAIVIFHKDGTHTTFGLPWDSHPDYS